MCTLKLYIFFFENSCRDPAFQAKLDELKAFQAKNGHLNIRCHCSEREKPLYYFIHLQRNRRKAFPERHHRNRAMTQAEIDALDAIGFDWGHPAASPPTGKQSKLAGRSLEDKKVEKSKQPKFPAIQRADLSPAGKDDELYVSLTGLLRLLLGCWLVLSHLCVQSDPSFKASLDKLNAYMEFHGHMNVAHAADPQLYHFIKRQRARRKALPARYSTHRAMTRAEIDALDAIGFDWWGSASGAVAKTGSVSKRIVSLPPPQQPSSPTVATRKNGQADDDDDEFFDAKMPAVAHTGPVMAKGTYGKL